MVKIREKHPLLPNGSIDISTWIERIHEERTQDQIHIIQKACEFAKPYEELKTPLNESCFHQGLVMAEILHDLGLDAVTLSAAILFDVSEYANIPLEKIKKELGEEVAFLVQGAQKLHSVQTKKISQTENLRRMLLAVVEDVRVVLIRLAEHTCEMQAARKLDEHTRVAMAEETLQIYAPLANRLGIGQLKWELEDLAFRFLEPTTYKQIAQLLDERRVDRQDYIVKVIQTVEDSLKKQGVVPEIFGRAKHIYSIWKKMQRKSIGYHEIYDVRAIRILVSSVRECYATLGTIHSLWQPIPKEFDDYIANPKPNGYRSLHTAVIGPDGRALEVQIRTFEMHKQAELGVAAHWRYKEGVSHDVGYETKLASLRQVLKWQEELSLETEKENEKENTEALKAEVFQDRVYVLTPKGNVIDLPQGATPLDFAYQVHTEIGNRCRGAKINGKMVTLTHSLKSGDQIEILTAKTGGPSRDWLNPQLGYLKTSRARAKAHQWFKRQDRDKNIAEGRDILEKELKRLGVEHLNFDSLAHQLKYPKIEDVFSALGGGDLRISPVLHAIQILVSPLRLKAASLASTASIPHPQASSVHPIHPSHAHPSRKQGGTLGKEKRPIKMAIQVAGIGNLFSQIAKCCEPKPGDEIIGYIALGRGVTVHKRDCKNILQAGERNKNRLIQVEWVEEKGEKREQYSVDIVVMAYDRSGLLRDISSVMASDHINILDVNSKTDKQKNTVSFRFTIEVGGLELLGKLFSRLQHLQNIIEVHRVK